MKLCCIFLLLVVLHKGVSLKSVSLKSVSLKIKELFIENVDYVHGQKKCKIGTFPRVLTKGTCHGYHPKKAFKAKCLTCVPEGVDAVCNAQGYLRAYLSSRMSAFNCHPLRPLTAPDWDRVYCPLGATCISNPDTPGLGVCCYGNLTASKGSTNGDKVCSKCKPECDLETETCQEDVDHCGELVYKCKSRLVTFEKEGYCVSGGGFGSKRYCRYDSDCGKYEKCCPEEEAKWGNRKVCSGIQIA